MEKEAVITELQRVAKLVDTTYLSRKWYGQHGEISSSAIERTFGSWTEAVLAAGLKPLPPHGISSRKKERLDWVNSRAPETTQTTDATDDELLDELLRLSKELGRRPSQNQLSAKSMYGPDRYIRRWGTVAAAYIAAKNRG